MHLLTAKLFLGFAVVGLLGLVLSDGRGFSAFLASTGGGVALLAVVVGARRHLASGRGPWSVVAGRLGAVALEAGSLVYLRMRGLVGSTGRSRAALAEREEELERALAELRRAEAQRTKLLDACHDLRRTGPGVP